MNKKPATLENLSESINHISKKMAEGFSAVDRHFKQVDKRFDKMESMIVQEIMRINERIDQVEHKLSTKIEGVEQRLDAKISAVHLDVMNTRNEIKEIKERIIKIQKNSMEDDDLIADMVITLQKRVTILENKFSKIKQ